MDGTKVGAEEDVSSAKAVLLGALAPGVNGPTWNTLKTAFLMLGLCLVAMLGLAFSSSDSALILHVTFLVLITATLFLLLSSVAKRIDSLKEEFRRQIARGYVGLLITSCRLDAVINETPVFKAGQGENSREFLGHMFQKYMELSRFLAETGLVSVEHQMKEMGLVPKDNGEISKKSK